MLADQIIDWLETCGVRLSGEQKRAVRELYTTERG